MRFFSKILKFLKESKTEARRVSWPTKKETLKYTLIVVSVLILFALIFGGFDYLFTKILKKFIITP
jgi:preprotein translocase subunit SecE